MLDKLELAKKRRKDVQGIHMDIDWSKLGALRTHLDETINLYKQQYDTAQRSNTVTVQAVLQLARYLDERYILLNFEDDVRSRIGLYKELLQMLSSGHGDENLETSGSIGLARALIDIHATEKNASDLEEAITLCRCILMTIGKTHPEYPETLRVLGLGLLCRSTELSNIADFEETIDLHQIALDCCPSDHPLRVRFLYTLGRSYLEHSRGVGGVESLRHSNRILRDALSLCDSQTADVDAIMEDSARASHNLGQETCNVSLLQDALSLYIMKIDVCKALRLPLAKVLTHISVTHIIFAELTHDMSSLASGLDYAQRALSLSLSDLDKLRAYSALASVLQLQFRYEGTISLIDTAIETRENVVAIHAAKGYQVQAFRNILNLSTCYGTRYEATGRRGDLDRSIELSREATKLSNETVELQRLAFGNLALSLTCRFDMAGDKDDLEEALALAKKAAATFPPDHFQHAMILSTLASVLFRRYLLYKDLNDLNSAVDMFSRCVTGTATRHYHQSDRQLSLAQAYVLRYQDATGLTDDIDRAIDLSREAVSLRPAEHSRRYEALNTLASALFSRYTSLENIPDYDCALSAQREALALLPEGHTYQARALFGLARIYLLEGTPTHSVANAISLCTKAIRSNNAVAHLSLKEVLEVLPALERAAALTSFPKEDRINLLALYREIISLFPRVAYFGLDLRTRLRVLAEAEHIATSAAFHAISLDLPEVAIELLEHGRAVFWSQSLRLREEFDALPSEMAEKLTSIAHRLESGSGSQPNPEAGKSVLEEQAKQMRMLSDEFQDLVVKARSIPGFERFLLDDTYETLCSVAEKGPVVVFVSANRRSCALILQKGLPLQRVDLDADPHMISRKFTLMLGNTRFMSKETRNGAANGHHAPLRLALKLLNKENGNAAVVEEMWIKVMKPVVTALGLRRGNGKDRPRVWLCPTGVFGLLPLHAAGVYGRNTECVADYFVPSYTPTLKALLNARKSFSPLRRSDVKALVAAVPVPFRGERLSAVIDEAVAARRAIPSKAVLALSPEIDCTIDPNNGPTVQTTLDTVPGASILHLASHGTQNYADALESGFMMQDGMLTVSKLMSLKLPKAFLAVLSACETAKGDASQPDQAVHLAATMLYVGFRSVVGTMWSMHDMDGPEVSETIYSELFSGNSEYLSVEDIPYALDAVVEKLRKRNLPISRWAPYVHIGI